jgi:cbb3-type cytochrome oxidase cytochrome c subunit
MIRHFKNPSQTIPGSNMPPILLNSMELNALSAFLLSARPETVANIDRVSAALIAGAQVYVQNSCVSCHKVKDMGGTIGPKLDGLSGRRSRAWIASHFANPQQLSPGTIMPPFHFSPRDEKNLIDYLLSLP